MNAAAVTGLVMEAMLHSVFAVAGTLRLVSATPQYRSTSTSSPRETSSAAPGITPSSTQPATMLTAESRLPLTAPQPRRNPVAYFLTRRAA